jgi:PAS domain-containing protein
LAAAWAPADSAVAPSEERNIAALCREKELSFEGRLGELWLTLGEIAERSTADERRAIRSRLTEILTSLQGAGGPPSSHAGPRLECALEAGRIGIWEWDRATDRLTWSVALERIHGIPAGSFPGSFEAYQRHLHPEDRE